MTDASPSPSPALLLLDLDGVVVFEHGPPWIERQEILLLHDKLSQQLIGLAMPVVVLTHRSRAEARRILEAAGLGAPVLAGVMAAEDLALAALRHRAIGRLLTKGLRKSLILPEVEARHGVGREDMALIDDRMDNLEDLLANGLGLALHAPSEIEPDGALISFDVAEAVQAIAAWRFDRSCGRLLELTAQSRPLEVCGPTGICTTKEGAHAFNYLRAAARAVRRTVSG